MSGPSALLRWYDARRRDLPWRNTRDPYRIWLSEVMLQQTRVTTAIPYYEAFLERFGTVEDLAAAPLEEVLASWSGLGYYRRARQLHRAAGEVVRRGGFPATSQGLIELPGIGPYTAAAVASIAFGEVVAVLDGNVERLLCRRLALTENPKRVAVRRRLREAAASLLDADRPGDSNQALMELGAMVCRPRRPKCSSCPLSHDCRARRRGDPERYPSARRKRALEHLDLAVAVVREDRRVLLFRRPETSDLLAGTWELPSVTHPHDRESIERALSQTYGGRWRIAAPKGKVRHGITYRRLILHVYSARFEAGESIAEGPEAAWVGEEERSSFAVSSMVDKALREMSRIERARR